MIDRDRWPFQGKPKSNFCTSIFVCICLAVSLSGKSFSLRYSTYSPSCLRRVLHTTLILYLWNIWYNRMCVHNSFCPICTFLGGQQTVDSFCNVQQLTMWCRDTDSNTIPLMFSCKQLRYKVEIRFWVNREACVQHTTEIWPLQNVNKLIQPCKNCNVPQWPKSKIPCQIVMKVLANFEWQSIFWQTLPKSS